MPRIFRTGQAGEPSPTPGTNPRAGACRLEGMGRQTYRADDLQAQLGPDEEVALRRVALGFSQGVAPDHIRRLKDLHLIELDKTSGRLTALGQRRFKALPRAARSASGATPDAVAMMLARIAELRGVGIADEVTVGAADAGQTD